MGGGKECGVFGRTFLGSGYLLSALRQHLTGNGKHLFSRDGAGKEAHTFNRVIAFYFVGISQDQNRQRRHSGMQFRDKRGTSNACQVVPGNDQAEVVGEVGLFNQAKRFSGTGDPSDV